MLSFFIRANFLFILLSCIGFHSLAGTPIINSTVYNTHQPGSTVLDEYMVNIEITEEDYDDFGKDNKLQYFTIGLSNTTDYVFVKTDINVNVSLAGGGTSTVPVTKPGATDFTFSIFTFAYYMTKTGGANSTPDKITITGLRIKKKAGYTGSNPVDLIRVKNDIDYTIGPPTAPWGMDADVNNLPIGTSLSNTSSLAHIVPGDPSLISLISLNLTPSTVCNSTTPVKFKVDLVPGALGYRYLEESPVGSGSWIARTANPDNNGEFTPTLSSSTATTRNFKVVADIAKTPSDDLVGWIEGQEQILNVGTTPAVPVFSKLTADDVCLDNLGNGNFSFKINNYISSQSYTLQRKSQNPASFTITGINSNGEFPFSLNGQPEGNQVFSMTTTSNGCSASSTTDVTVKLIKSPDVPVLSKLIAGNVCLDGSPTGNGNFDFKINNYTSPTTQTYTLHRSSPSVQDVNVTSIINSNGEFNYTLTGESAGAQVYNIKTTSGICSATSQNITVNVAAKPSITMKGNILPTIPISTTDMPRLIDGVNGVIDYTTGMNPITFTVDANDLTRAGSALEANGNLHQFNPFNINANDFGPVRININGAVNGCSADQLTVTFDVRDGNASIPSFVKPVSKMPICENYPNNRFDLIAYIRNCGINLNPGSPGGPSSAFTMTATYDTGTLDLISGKKITVDEPIEMRYTPTENNVDLQNGQIIDYAYAFYINPLRNVNYVVKITITPTSSSTCFVSTLSGYIPISPRRAPFLTGLSVKNGQFTPLCSASHDTISMNANPSNGIYKYYKGKLTDIPFGKYSPEELQSVNKLIKLTSSIRAIDPPNGDWSLEKFVPYDVFTKHLSSSLDSVIVVEYVYPNGSVSCPDTTVGLLSFQQYVDVNTNIPDKICFGDTLKLKTVYNTAGIQDQSGQDAFYWSFGDGFTIKSDTNSYQNYIYKNPGLYPVRFKSFLSKLPSNTCNNDILDTIRVGAQPKADFLVSKNFIDSNTVFKSSSRIDVATLAGTDNIVSWVYKFGTDANDKNEGNTNTDITFKYPNEIKKDPYTVTHIVTATYGCKDSISYKIPIFPIRHPDEDKNHLDTFDITDLNGWYQSGQYALSNPKSSWVNSTLNGDIISSITENNAAWATLKPKDTINANYYADEHTWVESSVFDLSQLSWPMVSLNSIVNTDPNFDGVSIQYTFCDNVPFGKEVWRTLGDYKHGLNWYNSKLVLGLQKDQFFGWTGKTQTDWQLSAYRLDEIKNLMNKNNSLVRFRVLLGTNGDNDVDYKFFEGFAFDNFFVGQRNRKVVVEEFCDYERYETQNKFTDGQAINIQYHTSLFTNNDEINILSPDEPSARALHYGIGKELPRGVVDGIYFNNDSLLSKWGPDEFFRRSLIVSPMKLDVTTGLTNKGDSLTVSVDIERINNSLEGKNLLVHIAIVEQSAKGNGITFTNVLRSLVPNAAGTRIDKEEIWKMKTIKGAWKPFANLIPNSDFNVIAFVQDEQTKEIYQAGMKTVDKDVVVDIKTNSKKSAEPEDIISFSDLYLSPNPVSQELKVLFNGILNDNYKWIIVDTYGRTIADGKFNKGLNAAFLEVGDFAPGIYSLKLEGEGRVLMERFAVVK